MRARPSFLLLFLLAGCGFHTYPPALSPASGEISYPQPTPDEDRIEDFEKRYYDLLERHTQRVRGFQNHVDTPVAYWVSYLSWPLALAEHEAQGARQMWDEKYWRENLETRRLRYEGHFVFRVDFYTEKSDENRISNAPDAPWRIFLVLPDGTRIEPYRSFQVTGEESELSWLYPLHTRHAKLYEIEFDRPLQSLAPDAAVRLEITGLPDTSSTTWYLGRDSGPPPAPQPPEAPILEPSSPAP